jgi:hypothetical protein
VEVSVFRLYQFCQAKLIFLKVSVVRFTKHYLAPYTQSVGEVTAQVTQLTEVVLCLAQDLSVLPALRHLTASVARPDIHNRNVKFKSLLYK